MQSLFDNVYLDETRISSLTPLSDSQSFIDLDERANKIEDFIKNNYEFDGKYYQAETAVRITEYIYDGNVLVNRNYIDDPQMKWFTKRHFEISKLVSGIPDIASVSLIGHSSGKEWKRWIMLAYEGMEYKRVISVFQFPDYHELIRCKLTAL